MTVCPAKTQISLGIRPVWSESSLCAQWVAKDLNFLHADSEDWSDWVDAQANLSFLRADSHFVGFVMRWLNFQEQSIHKSTGCEVITIKILKIQTAEKFAVIILKLEQGGVNL